MDKNKKIIVLVGGPSTEAEVSRRTGGAICNALVAAGYNAEKLELNPKTVMKDLVEHKAEIVFNALHGKYGEDGAIQGLLEMADIPYTGSGVTASAVCMNKKVSKDLFVGAGIPTATSLSFDSRKESPEEMMKAIENSFSYPVVVKAATQGSSIGVTIAHSHEELKLALADSLTYDHLLVVEKYLDGGEFTVAVLDGKALPVIQIKPKSGNYDYQSKYTVGATEYLVPAPISEELAAKMQAIGEATYQAVQCAGVARVDIMTDKEGNAYVLEVNTVPGMTETSLVPKAAKAMGMDFTALCENILKTASVNKW